MSSGVLLNPKWHWTEWGQFCLFQSSSDDEEISEGGGKGVEVDLFA